MSRAFLISPSVTPTGIEPVLPPWKGGVLAAWPRGLFSLKKNKSCLTVQDNFLRIHCRHNSTYIIPFYSGYLLALLFIVLKGIQVWAIGSYPITSCTRIRRFPKPIRDWYPQSSPVVQIKFFFKPVSCGIIVIRIIFFLPWATNSSCLCYTPYFYGLTANQLVWYFLQSTLGYQPSWCRILLTFRVSVYCVGHKQTTLTSCDSYHRRIFSNDTVVSP